MSNNTHREIAQLFSNGKFSEAEQYLSENIEWNIYEEQKALSGKKQVVEFGRSVSEYFKSLTTKFETFGIIEEGNKLAIHGRGEFIRESKTVNIVYSCDVYEFNEAGLITKIYSYCNSNRPQ
jgi:hypothetical protein